MKTLHKIGIISCGCSNFFPFLKILEKNVQTFFKTMPTIYDLGMKPEQRIELQSNIVTITVDAGFKEFNNHNNIKTSHKASCVAHFLNNIGDSCLYVDADILFTAALKDDDPMFKADLSVTPRHPKESGESYMKNGMINAGVMFFRKSPAMMNLLERWHEKSHKRNYTDQMAMSEILKKQVDFSAPETVQKLGELDVRLMDARIYNDVSRKSGKLLHFKNAARREDSLRKYNKMAKLLGSAPQVVSLVWRMRRLLNV